MNEIPSAEHISVEINDHVATVWMDRPDALNAMAPQFWR
ncbi:MAG: enoyl-CoA hydratase, partial [Acidimicrobiia bacterium]|nr:enoyl-CoA hydratase [Acidimicrobiia bacterium]